MQSIRFRASARVALFATAAAVWLVTMPAPADAQSPGGCPPGWFMLNNGSCGTPDQARAELTLRCRSRIHGAIAVPSATGGFECGCPTGTAVMRTPLLPWIGRDSCVPLQYIAANAAAVCTRQNRGLVPSAIRADGSYDCQCPQGQVLLREGDSENCRPLQYIASQAVAMCKRDNPDLVPSAVRADGTFDCLCPEGLVLRPASRDNPRASCVSAQSVAFDAALCERTLAGSFMGWDNQGRRTCVCQPGYVASAAEKKCVSDSSNGETGMTLRIFVPCPGCRDGSGEFEMARLAVKISRTGQMYGVLDEPKRSQNDQGGTSLVSTSEPSVTFEGRVYDDGVTLVTGTGRIVGRSELSGPVNTCAGGQRHSWDWINEVTWTLNGQRNADGSLSGRAKQISKAIKPPPYQRGSLGDYSLPCNSLTAEAYQRLYVQPYESEAQWTIRK